MNASKLVVSNIGRSVGSATMLLLSGSSSDDDSGDSSSRQRLLRGGVFLFSWSRFVREASCWGVDLLLRLQTIC